MEELKIEIGGGYSFQIRRQMFGIYDRYGMNDFDLSKHYTDNQTLKTLKDGGVTPELLARNTKLRRHRMEYLAMYTILNDREKFTKILAKRGYSTGVAGFLTAWARREFHKNPALDPHMFTTSSRKHVENDMRSRLKKCRNMREAGLAVCTLPDIITETYIDRWIVPKIKEMAGE